MRLKLAAITGCSYWLQLRIAKASFNYVLGRYPNKIMHRQLLNL
jgi:hypothetical protein